MNTGTLPFAPDGTIPMPSTRELKENHIRSTALQHWSNLCEYGFSDGAKVAMKAVGEVARIYKGHDARTTMRLIKEAQLDTEEGQKSVIIRLSVNKQKDLKANDDKLAKGDIKPETHAERVKQIVDKYESAGAYFATFSLPSFQRDVAVIREHMGTLGSTVAGKLAKGAQRVWTIDEALQTIFGYKSDLKDLWNSIKLGLANR